MFFRAKNSIKLFLPCVMKAESEIQDGGMDFCLPLASHMIKNSSIEFLDMENMGIAVGIAQL